MKLSILMPVLLLVSACESTDYATRKHADPSVSREQFEKIKALAGTWNGQGGDGAQQFPVEVRYRVTAGGSAVEETLFPGSAHEMITMYHLRGDALMLTHYCAAGNQPSMLARSDAASGEQTDVLRFDFSGGVDPSQDHMHEAEFRFLGTDHIQSVWTFFRAGKQAEQATFDVTRTAASQPVAALADMRELPSGEIPSGRYFLGGPPTQLGLEFGRPPGPIRLRAP